MLDVITQPQSAPSGWPTAGTFNGQLYDYGMDPDIVNSGNADIGGVQQVKDALSAIPSISISLRQSDFSGGGGIYSNPGNRGIAWERPASAERSTTRERWRSSAARWMETRPTAEEGDWPIELRERPPS